MLRTSPYVTYFPSVGIAGGDDSGNGGAVLGEGAENHRLLNRACGLAVKLSAIVVSFLPARNGESTLWNHERALFLTYTL